ncbi:hypothetical protein Ddye_024668 [Dipteronia dyeriana]|uniref:Uncharacterized protein n=1 Tax=Dipteronia dyeriana TaxID=168575 RepID=A0AAD9TV97_9ROSI|nr:hypothetical protein Ddye_024668 [Dipteronia dyeriana]
MGQNLDPNPRLKLTIWQQYGSKDRFGLSIRRLSSIVATFLVVDTAKCNSVLSIPSTTRHRLLHFSLVDDAAWRDRSCPSALRLVLGSNNNTIISFQFSEETGCFMVMIFESRTVVGIVLMSFVPYLCGTPDEGGAERADTNSIKILL